MQHKLISLAIVFHREIVFQRFGCPLPDAPCVVLLLYATKEVAARHQLM